MPWSKQENITANNITIIISVCVYSPQGKTFRSKASLQAFLLKDGAGGLHIDLFNFSTSEDGMRYTSLVVAVDTRPRRRQKETDTRQKVIRTESVTDIWDAPPSRPKTNRKQTSPTRTAHQEAAASEQTSDFFSLIRRDAKEGAEGKAEKVCSGAVESVQVFSRGGACETVNPGERLTQAVSLTTVGDSQPESHLRSRGLLREKLFKLSAALTSQANTCHCRQENTQPGPPPPAIVVTAEPTCERGSEGETEQGRCEEKVPVEDELKTQSEFKGANGENELDVEEKEEESLSPAVPDDCSSPAREYQSMYDAPIVIPVMIMLLYSLYIYLLLSLKAYLHADYSCCFDTESKILGDKRKTSPYFSGKSRRDGNCCLINGCK